jgi:hypothetical protein
MVVGGEAATRWMRFPRTGDVGAAAASQNPWRVELVSPELVLVAPPELARLAREQLQLPWQAIPAGTGPAEAGRQRWPVAVFGLLCTLNGIAPLALAIVFRH